MTLIVALKYQGGVVLASDSRVMYGEMKRDQARKLEPLTNDIGIAAAGLLGAIDDVLRAVKAFCNSQFVSFDDVVSHLSDENFQWFKENAERLEEEQGAPVFIAVSPERIRRIFEKGYSEEAYDYACEGSGRAYAEYILRNFYKENLEEKEAQELAVYIILETSKMDPSVGEDIQLLVFSKKEKCKIIKKEDMEDIKARLAPLSRSVAEGQVKTIGNIVEMREEINNLWEKIFAFKLLRSNEKAISQIMKPCRSGNEFTNNIGALSLLIDQLSIKEMKEKIVEKRKGSINVLEEFLRKEIKNFPPEIVSNLRDIMTMRSKRFPVHATAAVHA